MTQLVWLRNDLRVLDNPALFYACQTQQPVRVIYSETVKQRQQHNESPAQQSLRQQLLISLSEALAALDISLEILTADYFTDLPALIKQYCQIHAIEGLWFNEQSWLNESIRDSQVTSLLKACHIDVHRFQDECLINSAIVTKDQTPYRVFTPWYRQWLIKLQGINLELLPAPKLHSTANAPRSFTNAIKTEINSQVNYRDDLWPASQEHALAQLISFCENSASDYDHARDYPAINGTSLLSPYIAVGALSVRQCVVYLQQACLKNQSSWLEHTWLKELAWREFYRYLMRNKPELAKGAAFNPQKESKWLDNAEHFKAWQQGCTGFPIIDAAMIQLKQTGWMHNRLRMLTASFLCKLLLIDWRKGEAHFLQHLIDGDFSSNNGGWQWSSSTGCDASPWFRIFNPTLQSRKFDCDGHFIRKMLPQLSALSDKGIHWPSELQRKTLNYHQPIIDYSASRERALLWRKVKEPN